MRTSRIFWSLLLLFLSLTAAARAQGDRDSLAAATTDPLTVQTAGGNSLAAVEQVWDAANTAYINSDYHRAIDAYRQLILRGYASDKLYYNLANAYFKVGRYGKAILYYNRALRLAPGDADIRYNLDVANTFTKDKIAAIEAEKTRVAMSAVVPEGSEFTDALEIPQAAIDAAKAQGGTVSELYGVTNGGAEAGYVAKVAASGSQGTITMMVGIDANGAITGISVVSHSETSGIGTKVVENKPNAAGTPVLDQFIGMSGAGTLAVGSNITAISGATVSTKGITMGANAALAAVEALG